MNKISTQWEQLDIISIKIKNNIKIIIIINKIVITSLIATKKNIKYYRFHKLLLNVGNIQEKKNIKEKNLNALIILIMLKNKSKDNPMDLVVVSKIKKNLNKHHYQNPKTLTVQKILKR
jgi:hypothetical protein